MISSNKLTFSHLKPVAGAAALALALLAGHSSVHALALGRALIQSSLGEPLAAEIDLPEITEDEERTLHIGLASPETYSSLGIQFNPALNGLRIAVKKRNDGRSYLEVRSDRPIVEPFVELVIQARWGSGQLQREYTFLLDPPKQAAKPAPVAATTDAPVAVAPVPAPAPAPVPAPVPAPAPAAAPAEPAPRPVVAAAPAASKAGGSITVARGDTAGALAARLKPAGVSLDQMLVAMLKANPDAFVQGNVNRLKAGAVVQMPNAEEASQTSTTEARRLIAAQSRDFNAFRQRLANAAPKAPAASSAREASGQIQTEVTDRQAQAQAEDKLTLSKGQAADAAAAAKIAQEKAAQDVTQQKTEAARNVDELTQLQAAVSAATAPAAEAAPAAPSTEPTPAPAPAAEPTPAPEPAAPPAPTATLPTPAAEPVSFWQGITSHPWALPGAGALLALLALFGVSRMRRNKTVEPLGAQESSFLDPTIQPDSSFGVRGTQRIDTAEMPSFQVSVMESPTGGSSLMYSPSQLDAAGDVDPVAEADVYLAYGKDIQAEEILNEALRSQPDRLPVRMKLLEIFARRQDRTAFRDAALRVQAITAAQGPEWATVVSWGKALDPNDALYTDEAEASSSLPLEPDDLPTDDTRNAFAAPSSAQPISAFDNLDVDLDLDLDKNTTTFQDNRDTSPMPIDGFGINTAAQSVDVNFGAMDGSAPAGAQADNNQAAQDPLRTKLSLAREFLSIGDVTAARAMAQEVLEQGDESLQAQAKALLASLG